MFYRVLGKKILAEEFYIQALVIYVQKQQKDFLWFTSAEETQGYLTDIVGSIPDHRDKANTVIKQAIDFFVSQRIQKLCLYHIIVY